MRQPKNAADARQCCHETNLASLHANHHRPFGGLFWDFDPFGRKGQASSTGSGVIVNADGYIVTNHHVIQGAEDIFIRTNENKEYKAKILGTDPLSDVAVLQIITDDKFETVKFGNSDTARI